MFTQLTDPSVAYTWHRNFGGSKSQQEISRVLEIRQFQDSFHLVVYGHSLMTVLCFLLCVFNKGEDWPLVLGAAVYSGGTIGVRFWLHRTPDQHRARAMFSFVYAVLGVVFVDGPLFLTRLIDAPTMPAANMYCVGIVMAIWAFFSVNIGIAFVPRMIERSFMLLGVASTQPTWSELGQPQQTVVTAAALLVGEIMAFVMNQRVWMQAYAQEQVHKQVSEIEQKTFRVINHMSKRVMSNAALSCDFIEQRLQPHRQALGADAQAILDMLDELRVQAINGFNMCKSRLLQTSIQRGEYTPYVTDFELRRLWEELGVAASSRVTCSEWCEGAAVRADKQILLCILSNAVDNALTHGKPDGPVVIRADLESTRRLRVHVSNNAGGNHRKLLALCGEGGDLFRTYDKGAALSSSGCGQSSSTFLGLGEIRMFTAALGPSARAHLRVHATSVRFELSFPAEVVVKKPQPKKPTAEVPVVPPKVPVVLPQALPADLAFVCCDDDLIPRHLYRRLLKTAKASQTESVVVGESYAQVAGLADMVVEKAQRLGHARVVCLFDEHLDFQEGSFQGSKIIADLRARDFSGLAIVRSANDEPDVADEYIAAGADGLIAKAVKGGQKAVLESISRLWHSKNTHLSKVK